MCRGKGSDQTEASEGKIEPFIKFWDLLKHFRTQITTPQKLDSELRFPEATFEASGQNLLIFKNSVCIFYRTEKDRLCLKNGPPWAEIFAKMFLNMARQTKP